MQITKIISGGQTGADIGALDAAIYCDVPHGGWCPKGRKQENRKTIPDRYNLKEMSSGDYLKRTEANVVDSDATLILTMGPLSGGSKRTMDFANKHNKPCLHIAIDQYSRTDITNFVCRWFEGDITELTPPFKCILNVAGNRESKALGIQQKVMILMVDILTAISGLSYYPLSDEYVTEYADESGDNLSDMVVETADPLILHHPKTINEAVDIVLNELSDENKGSIRKQDKDEFVINAHFGLGLFVRNTMIHQNKNQVDLMADYQKRFCGDTDWIPVDADTVSGVIVGGVWDELLGW